MNSSVRKDGSLANARCTVARSFVTVACAVLTLSTCAGAAGSKPRVAAPKTLSFTLSARISAQGSSGQTWGLRVFTKGNRVRVESTLASRSLVLLITPPYLYKLMPAAGAGVRWTNSRLDSGSTAAPGFDLQSLLRDPARIKALLASKGAHRTGATVLNGTPAELYVVAKPGATKSSQPFAIKAWLRKSDAAPLRLIMNNGSWTGTVSWRDYKRDIPLADSLFTVPKSYKIRNATGAPDLFSF